MCMCSGIKEQLVKVIPNGFQGLSSSHIGKSLDISENLDWLANKPQLLYVHSPKAGITGAHFPATLNLFT